MAADWLLPVIIGAPGLVAGTVAWLKVRPETRKLRSEAAAGLAASAGDLVADFTEDVKDLRNRLRGLEKRERLRDRMLLVHHEWDLQLVSQARAGGIDVAPPPPLWTEEDGD